MNIIVQRQPSTAFATLGTMAIDGNFAFYTLEDVVRPVKIQDDTAIPAGTYAVTITPSQRFGRDMPLVENVPGFTGIRIHSGNTDKDTDGCILLGTTVEGEDFVGNSKAAFALFFVKLQNALNRGESCTIEIRDAQEAV